MAKTTEPPPSLERPVTKSLLGGKKKTPDSQRPPPPFKVGDSQQVSLGLTAEDEVEWIFPWMHIGPCARQGEQLQMAAGDYEITVLLDYKLAEKHAWQIAELVESIHGQTLAWLHHKPDEGLTVRVAKIENEQE